ncbi:hypothetical protein DWB77_03991 [Streptomyces hundungensis]|uniref:Uncharacterized protein n=1 Tax=Streptomyces hundungensis TaxID=1077946 RepID=A0A387HEH2_9ACTN|nr:hypothetical protein [Streptomyces hundungensis]AYG81824.1 hypothetical protein DWB77_03991 [Streptomyces hundungensis]
MSKTPLTPRRDDTYNTVMELRAALAEHGITLPSLGRDFGTPPLVILGNCNADTARALTAALERHPEPHPAHQSSTA